jgi:valyl-tRNA synthetase
MLNMLDADARVCQTADGLIPADLLGLDRFEARDMVVKLLEEAGALEKVEDRVIQTPFGDRSGVVIEPWLTDQWYVDAATLAKPALEAVRSGDIRVVPETWKKTWYNWLENIQPWCVSRQLWWGHQIPAWYDEDGQVYVAETEAEAQSLAGNKPLTRDTDVLDTWFSSALWPFATLGWPEDDKALSPGGRGLGEGASPNSLLARHYPNDVLISGFDILFFWDARMAMQGLHFMGERPWKTLYLHGLVRDAHGQKMSKSKGNTVDPLGLIDKYGADALRFTMAAMESQGRDIKLDEKRVEGYRNFATKLWNAARFAQSNGIGGSTTLDPPKAELAVNRWIIGQTIKTVQALDLALADLRFDESANTVYHFVWASFCDWYLELIKPILSPLPAQGGDQGVGASGEAASSSAAPEGESPSAGVTHPNPSLGREGLEAAETRAVAGWVLDQILAMLHPFMPFITEELWHALADRKDDLIVGHWPMVDARAIDPDASAEVEWLIKLVSEIRAARSELNVPPGARLNLFVADASAETAARLDRQHGVLSRLARLDSIQLAPFAGKGAAQVVVDEATFALPLEGVIDLDAERARLAKGAEAAEKERDSLAGRLANPSFVERAKPEAVTKAREDHDAKAAEADRLRAALARLG